MGQATLEQLGVLDGAGRHSLRVVADPGGDLVLCSPAAPLEKLGGGLRELNLQERLHLAALASDRPALVVEGEHGRYVVLADRSVDLDRHVPLGPDDAELLLSGTVRARFGRRDDDVLTLTPWADEDEVEVFTADAPGFAEVAVLTVDEEGSLTWHRGGVDAEQLPVVHGALERMAPEPGTAIGVLTNAFGEVLCVEDGTPLLPHEDIRRQTLMTTASLLEDAASLGEAVGRLRAVAERLSAAEQAGWRLVHPVVGGIAFAEHARGD